LEARFCDACGHPQTYIPTSKIQAVALGKGPSKSLTKRRATSLGRTDSGSQFNRRILVALLIIGIIGAAGGYYFYRPHGTGSMERVTTTVSVQASPTSVGLTGQGFVGNWMNIDPNTGGWIRAVITQYGESYSVHIWGACTPNPCDGGSAPLVVDGPTAAHAFFNHGFATLNMTFLLLSQGELQITTFTHFTDNSGRTDYTRIDTFYKS